MKERNIQEIDLGTKNLLTVIEDIREAYTTGRIVSDSECSLIRIRLRDAFDRYYEVVERTERNYGVEFTMCAREVIQTAIADVMSSTEIAVKDTHIEVDLEVYSMIMAQSLVHIHTVI